MTIEEFVSRYNADPGKMRPPLYEKIVGEYHKAIAHTRGANMAVLLKNYRPKEDYETLKRREQLLEPITKDIFDRTTDSIIRILSPEIVSIDSSEEVASYMAESSYWALMQYSIAPNMFDDPNGFLVCMVKANSDRQNVPASLIFWVVNYEQVIGFSPNHIAFYKELEGAKYAFYVSETTAQRFAIGDDKKLVADTAYSATYKIPVAPFIQLGGRMTRSADGKHYYASFFSSAFAHATKAVQIFSDREAMRMTANPLVIMAKQPCDAQGCAHGRLYGVEGHDDGEACSSCGGSGYAKQRWNINDVILLDKEDLGEQHDIENFIKFAVPPTENVKMQEEFSQGHLKKAEQALNLIFVEQAQSGTAKEIDREQQEAMVNAIAKNVFGRLAKFSFQIAEYIIGDASQKVEVVMPSDFRQSTPSAMLMQINELKAKGAALGVLYPMYRQLYTSMFAKAPCERRKAMLALDNDPLHLYATIAEKRLASANEREFEISKQLPSALNRLENEVGQDAFLAMSDKQAMDRATALMNLPTEQTIIRDANGN